MGVTVLISFSCLLLLTIIFKSLQGQFEDTDRTHSKFLFIFCIDSVRRGKRMVSYPVEVPTAIYRTIGEEQAPALMRMNTGLPR